METQYKFSIEPRITIYRDPGPNVHNRLEWLLEANAEIAKYKAEFPTRTTELELAMMKRPLTAEQTFAWFGAMLGTFPPATLFGMFLVSSDGPEPALVAALLGFVTAVTAVAGYFLGKIVAALITNIRRMSLSSSLLLVPLVGFCWGAVSGAAGGVFLFIIGAFFGGAIGGAVGAVALTAFFLLYRKLTVAGMIELKHFLPLSFGVTFTICAYLLSLYQ